jgi:tetratricopeptide (TPR) repeat protein
MGCAVSARGQGQAQEKSLGRSLWAPLVLALAAFAIGCAESHSSRSTPAAETAASACSCEPIGAPVVDPTLLAFLSKARAAHHEADLVEQGEGEGQGQDRPRAIRVLSQLVQGPQPGGASPSPEVAEVIADTRARLADLRSSDGDFDAAIRDVDEGLRLAQTNTHFRGHLFEVRGVVQERRSKALAEKGDAAGAEKAKKDALDAFEKAIEIQDDVIARALEQKGAEPPFGKGGAAPR